MTMVSRERRHSAEPQAFDGELPTVLQILAADATRSAAVPQS
jgi:hypothetical protein